jgi:hypothetical protein
MPIPVQLNGLSIIHNALRDLWPEQNNLVNIERDGMVQTLNFTGTVEWQSVTFE